MDLPKIGQLKKRVRFLVKTFNPSDDWGFQDENLKDFTRWGLIQPVGSVLFWGSSQIETAVTHRVFVRCEVGKTDAASLSGVTHVLCDGMEYKIQRIADVQGVDRFTVMDVELLGKEERYGGRDD